MKPQLYFNEKHNDKIMQGNKKRKKIKRVLQGNQYSREMNRMPNKEFKKFVKGTEKV